MEYFPNILDYNFTANVEEFDSIADGEMIWASVIDNFYKLFHPIVEATTAIKTDIKLEKEHLV